MKYSYLVLFLPLFLSGCQRQMQDQVQQCMAEMSVKYPADKSLPMGQPYNDIVLCMRQAGYVIDYDRLHCKERDYTSLATDATCYRPTGFFKGYLNDVFSIFR